MRKLVLSMCLGMPLLGLAGRAQTAASPAIPEVPTTKILAIGHLTGPRTPELIKLVASKEAPATVRLFLAGKIDQWYSLKEGNGVVFLLNMSSVAEAHAMLEKLPLGQAKLMTFELIPIGPLGPLGLLLKGAETPAP